MRSNTMSAQPPMLGVPERIWLFPKKQSAWVALGVLWLPILISVCSMFDKYAYRMVGQPFWLATWLLAVLVSVFFAFFAPGGLHAGEWFSAWLIYRIQPKHAVCWRD